MDIAALSMGLSQMKFAQEAGVSILKMAMDQGQNQLQGLTEMMGASALEQSVNPHLGTSIDVRI